MASPQNYNDNVFINCPFDGGYHAMFEAMVFSIHECGFIARCAREEDDAGNVRVMKIMKIIDECRYGIHDISKADLDVGTNLARFNMPLELGLFLGAKNYAAPRHYNKDKRTLILDIEPYRYQIFISDLAGQDISSHNSEVSELINQVLNFLLNNSRRQNIPGGAYIADRYQQFQAGLPDFCDNLHWNRDSLTFIEYMHCVVELLKLNPL